MLSTDEAVVDHLESKLNGNVIHTYIDSEVIINKTKIINTSYNLTNDGRQWTHVVISKTGLQMN